MKTGVFFSLIVLFLLPCPCANAVTERIVINDKKYNVYIHGQIAGLWTETVEFYPVLRRYKYSATMKTVIGGVETNDSVGMYSHSDITPIYMHFWKMVGGNEKVIEVMNRGKHFEVKVTVSPESNTFKLPMTAAPPTVFAEMLPFQLLSQPGGLATGTEYTYSVFDSQTLSIKKGSASIITMENVRGTNCFKILNKMSGEAPFYVWIDKQGSTVQMVNKSSGLVVLPVGVK